jgi:phosphoglycolate phosphatase
VGAGARLLIERCVAAAGQPSSDVQRIFERFLAIYRSRLTETTDLYPGLDEILRQLAPSARLAVLTNKPGDMSRAVVQALGLEQTFFAVIGAGDLKTKKPDPGGLLKLATEAGVAGADVAMVGDSAIDIETARNAGVFSVGVRWGYDREGMEQASPDAIVETPAELLKALTR